MRYNQLDSISKRNFEEIFRELSMSLPREKREEFVRREWNSSYACCFRRNAISMISALHPTIVEEPEDIGLELDARRNPRTSPEVVDYTLITEPLRARGSYALSIQAFGPNPQGVKSTFPTFQAAYRQAKEGQSEWLRVPDTTNKTTTHHIYYSIKASALPDDGFAERLAEGLSQRHYLSYGQRKDLAYRLADSCLLLLNTSWMSALSSENLIIRIEDKQPAKYSLRIREMDRARCQILQQLNNGLEGQLYSIGILLIELATQSKVTKFQMAPQPPSLTMDDHEVLELDEAISKTKRALGQSFSEVVSYCFLMARHPDPSYHEDEMQRKDLELDMLYDFHNNIFMP
ncbi:hypothetical protein BGZ57DRAFT_914764 [Hyaloscypha finlandica]|nr:hypothetical protein BGZ57DRAFT_914764 [Hyaloscypha finlandica]